MAYDGRAVANFLLDLAEELGLKVTHMALHKIAFFAHGWRLAQTGEALIKQPFEAWKYGPVLNSVYQGLKDSGDKPVTSRIFGFNYDSDTEEVVSATFSPQERRFLRDILQAYGGLSGVQLSRMTHRPGGAWDRVWNAPGGKITLGMRITNEAIRADFLSGDSAEVTDKAS